MTTEILERRVLQLEEQMQTLLDERKSPRKKDWRRTVGQFDGDEVMKEIIDEGQLIREADRQQAQS